MLACPLRRSLTQRLGLCDDRGRYVCLRSDRVHVGVPASQEGALTAPALVQQVRWLGASYELALDTGSPLVATVSAQEYQRLGCRVGQTLSVSIDSSDAHAMDSD